MPLTASGGKNVEVEAILNKLAVKFDRNLAFNINLPSKIEIRKNKNLFLFVSQRKILFGIPFQNRLAELCTQCEKRFLLFIFFANLNNLFMNFS